MLGGRLVSVLEDFSVKLSSATAANIVDYHGRKHDTSRTRVCIRAGAVRRLLLDPSFH